MDEKMMDEKYERVRALKLDPGKCIGCRACFSACPDNLISLSETRGIRKICFPKTCDKNCEHCVLACPAEALRFVFSEGEEKGQAVVSPVSGIFELHFELESCGKCGVPFATEKELEWVLGAIKIRGTASVPAYAWEKLCPSCRRAVLRGCEAGVALRVRGF